MAGYVIFHYKITDRSQIDKLTGLSLPVNNQFGAKVIVGSPVKAVEGNALTHIVILKFDSFDLAQTFYHSKEHAQITKLRNEITEGWAAIVPGDSETQQVVDSGYFN